MARHVILTFEDNAEAEAFVKTVQAATSEDPFAFMHSELWQEEVTGTKHRGWSVKPVEGGVSVVGMYMKPTAFCDCPHPGDRSVRGAKYGLFVHTDCAKPKPGIWQYPRNLLWKDSIKELIKPNMDRRYAMLGIQEGAESPPLIDLNISNGT